MVIELTVDDADTIGADLVAVAAGLPALERGVPERAISDADPVAIVYPQTGIPRAVVALEPDVEGLRTAAARAVRTCRRGGTVAWILDKSLPLATVDQVRAPAEGAVLGGYDGRRWRSGEPLRGVERFVIWGAGKELGPAADRAALIARWTNVARELVDAPTNVISPAELADRAVKIAHLDSETIQPGEAGLTALAAVGSTPGVTSSSRSTTSSVVQAATRAVTSRGHGRSIRATGRCSTRPSPTCATPPARASASRSSPPHSFSSSRAKGRGPTSTCSASACVSSSRRG